MIRDVGAALAPDQSRPQFWTGLGLRITRLVFSCFHLSDPEENLCQHSS